MAVLQSLVDFGRSSNNDEDVDSMISNIEQLVTNYGNTVNENYSLEPVTKFKNDLNKLITSYALWDLINWSIPWSGKGRTLDYGLNRDGNYILNGGSEFYIPSRDYLNYEFTPILTIEFTPIKQQDERIPVGYFKKLFNLVYGKEDEVESERSSKKKLDGGNI